MYLKIVFLYVAMITALHLQPNQLHATSPDSNIVERYKELSELWNEALLDQELVSVRSGFESLSENSTDKVYALRSLFNIAQIDERMNHGKAAADGFEKVFYTSRELAESGIPDQKRANTIEVYGVRAAQRAAVIRMRDGATTASVELLKASSSFYPGRDENLMAINRFSSYYSRAEAREVMVGYLSWLSKENESDPLKSEQKAKIIENSLNALVRAHRVDNKQGQRILSLLEALPPSIADNMDDKKLNEALIIMRN